MPPFVLDAAMTLSWCFVDEATAYSRSVLAALSQPKPPGHLQRRSGDVTGRRMSGAKFQAVLP